METCHNNTMVMCFIFLVNHHIAHTSQNLKFYKIVKWLLSFSASYKEGTTLVFPFASLRRPWDWHKCIVLLDFLLHLFQFFNILKKLGIQGYSELPRGSILCGIRLCIWTGVKLGLMGLIHLLRKNKLHIIGSHINHISMDNHKSHHPSLPHSPFRSPSR